MHDEGGEKGLLTPRQHPKTKVRKEWAKGYGYCRVDGTRHTIQRTAAQCAIMCRIGESQRSTGSPVQETCTYRVLSDAAMIRPRRSSNNEWQDSRTGRMRPLIINLWRNPKNERGEGANSWTLRHRDTETQEAGRWTLKRRIVEGYQSTGSGSVSLIAMPRIAISSNLLVWVPRPGLIEWSSGVRR